MVKKPLINVLLAHITNRWSRNGQKVEYIVLHYVGAVSSAEANARYLNRDGNLGWSAHFFTDQYSIWQSVPLDESAGHCGVDYSYGKAPFWGKCRNKNSIGIEMCCKKDSGGNWYIEPETVTRAVGLVKWLMQEYNIPADHVIRHYDVCWKDCPEPWVRDPAQWKAFKARLVADNTTKKQEEEEMVRYKTVKEMPGYIQPYVNKLIELGHIRGRTKDNLDITEDMARVAIWFARMEGVEFEEGK